MPGYPDQTAKLRLILKCGDRRNVPEEARVDYDDRRQSAWHQQVADLLEMEVEAFSKCLNGKQFFPSDRIGSLKDYEDRDGVLSKKRSIEWGLLAEFIGIDQKREAVNQFHHWFVSEAAPELSAAATPSDIEQWFRQRFLGNAAGNLDRAVQPGERPLSGQDTESFSSLLNRFVPHSQFCGVLNQNPHRQGHRVGFPAEANLIALPMLSVGQPAWLEFRSPSGRDGRTPLWTDWWVILLEQEVGSKELKTIMPGVEGFAGWEVEKFPGKSLTLPTGKAIPEGPGSTLWTPEEGEINRSFEVFCIASRERAPEWIRSAIRRPAGGNPKPQSETAPGFLALATWLAPLLEAEKAGVAKVRYKVVAPDRTDLPEVAR